MERVNPSGVTYSTGAIPLATPAKSSTRKFYPNNGRVFSYSGLNIIQIPLAAEGMFLDASSNSFLKFDLIPTFTVNSADATVDGHQSNNDKSKQARVTMCGGGAHCWIQRMRILSATGQQLEDIQDYHVLHSLLQDMTCSPDHVGTVLGTKSGAAAHSADPGSGKTLDNLVGASQGDNSLADVEADARGMEYLPHPGENPADELKMKRTYCLNLVSGLLNQPKYLPLLMTKGGLQIELVLEDPSIALMASKVPGTALNGASTTLVQTLDYKLQNVEYVAELVDFGPEFNSNFIQMMAGVGGALMSGITYRNHKSTLKQTDTHVDISERARSIKSIMTSFRRQDHSTGTLKTALESLRARVLPSKTTGYQYRVGSITYPDHFVKIQDKTNVSEAFCHVLRALGGGSLVDVQQGTRATRHNFAVDKDETGMSTTLCPCNVIAATFESFNKDSERLESGLNSASQSLPIELTLERPGTALNVNYDVNAFVKCDAMFNFLPNGDIVSSI